MEYPPKTPHPGCHPGAELPDVVNYEHVAKAMEGSPTHKHFAPRFRELHESKHRCEGR